MPVVLAPSWFVHYLPAQVGCGCFGGRGGATVRKGDLLATVDSRDEVVTLTGRFMQYYRENAKWLERSYDFVPRVGLAELPKVPVR